jgi:conjugal transfer pilus assembly protein TraE
MHKRNIYLALAAGSIISNILLSLLIFVILSHEKIVIVPPTIEKTFWISGNEVSSEYLAEMALFFVNLRFNLTPNNAETQRNMLLRYVTPSYYGILKTDLLSESDKIKRDHITTTFYQSNIEVDQKKYLVKITGDIQSTIGDMMLPFQRVSYQIHFVFNAGRLLVDSFDEVKVRA